MTDAQEKILRKIAALKRHAESAETIGNEAEAQAFAAMFQKLLVEHKLEMSDIEFTTFEREEPVGKHRIDYTQYPDLKLKRTRVAWVEELADIIARAHFCRILVHTGSSRVTLVGRPSDAKVAEYMLVTLQRATVKLADAEYGRFSIECVNECEICRRQKNNHRDMDHIFVPNWRRCRGFRPAFINSFIARLSVRYTEYRRNKSSDSTALVRLNKSDKAVVDFMEMKKDNGKPVISSVNGISGQVRFNREGDKRGRAAADKISLDGQALPSGGERQKLR